jgi:hypothetical protein
MSGRLGKVEAGNGSFTTLYAVPAGAALATVNILVTNTNNVNRHITIAISTTTTPGSADFISYNFDIPPYGVVERTALVLSPGEVVLVSSNGAGMICRAHGYQKGG